MIKAGPLPSSALCCTPSSVLRTPRTPSRLRSLSAVQPDTFGLGLTRLPGRVSPVPRCSFPTCRRPLPRRGPSSIPVRDDVCCLRRDMSGSALSNTFRLIICRGCSVHFMLRPAGSLPSVARAFDTPLGPVGSLLPAGVCYRAPRRFPGQDLHLLEQRVFQDAPWSLHSKEISRAPACAARSARSAGLLDVAYVRNTPIHKRGWWENRADPIRFPPAWDAR